MFFYRLIFYDIVWRIGEVFVSQAFACQEQGWQEEEVAKECHHECYGNENPQNFDAAKRRKGEDAEAKE